MLLIERIVGKWFRNKNLLGVKEFYNSNSVSVSDELEKNFPKIRREYDEIIKHYDNFAPFQSISPDQTYISNDDKWRLFFLKGAGIWFKRNCLSMPITHSILKRHSNVVSAYISVLGPRKKLNLHAGPYSGVLRLHLALDIPHQQRCCLSVNGQRTHWEQGRCLFFDDTYEHFAANDTDKLRAVLFMDILKPLPWHLNFLNKAIIKIARIFPYVWIPWRRHKRWEKDFYNDSC